MHWIKENRFQVEYPSERPTKSEHTVIVGWPGHVSVALCMWKELKNGNVLMHVCEVAIEYGRWWLASGSRDSVFSDGPSFKNHEHMDTNGRFNLREIRKESLWKFMLCEYSEWLYSTAAERPKHVDRHHICTRPQGQLDEPQLPIPGLGK